MSASALLATTLAFLAPCQQQQQPQPMEGDELYTSIEQDGITFRYLDNEMNKEEANKILGNFRAIRSSFTDFLAIEPGQPPVITARIRSGSPRYYHTNGEDKIFLDYPSHGHFRPVVNSDNRIRDYGRYLYAELWLHQYLSSTAGLHPSLLDSIVEYLGYRQQLASDPDNATPPAGAGDVWFKLDTIYGDGMTSFVLNNMAGQSVPAHQLPAFLASVAVDATEDELARDLFAPLGALDPMFSEEEFEPSPRLSPESPLRLSRLALFNGVRLMDTDAEPLSRAEKFRDFDVTFAILTRSYPDRGLRGTPRRINGVDAWRTYAEFRARVEKSRDNLDFFLVMREFMSRFQDRWVMVSSPHGGPAWKGVRGLSMVRLGDRFHVASVTADTDAERAGVQAGMELVELNGREVGQVWRSLTRYFDLAGSCSSTNVAAARALNVLLTGPANSTARFKLRSTSLDGGPVDLEVELPCGAPRSATESTAEVKMVETALREDGIGILTVRAFVGPAAGQFSVALDSLLGQNAKGIVIDLRGNETGDPLNAVASIGRLLDRRVSVGNLAYRNMEQPMGNIVDTPITLNPMPNLKPYLGPAAVLTDAWTAGAGELFAMGFLLSGRGQVVGHSTAGALNSPMPPQPWQTLTGSGLTITLTLDSVTDRAGKRIHGQGLVPTLPVEPTVADLAAGVDTVLEAAASSLLEG